MNTEEYRDNASDMEQLAEIEANAKYEKHLTERAERLAAKSVFEKIIENAKTFRVPLAKVPTNHGIERLAQFHQVLTDEVDELLDDVSIVNVADTLADVIVFCLNEGARWGIPMEQVLHLVIDSQRSKLLPNGEPLWAEDGSKYLKGPNFVPPEPKIARLLADVAMADDRNVYKYVKTISPMSSIVDKCIK